MGKVLSLGPVGPTTLLGVFSLSIATIGLLPKLPELEKLLGAYLITVLVVVLAFPRRGPWIPLLLVSLAGSSWAVWSNQKALDQRLPLWAHGSDHSLEVEVVSLPETRSTDTEHWQRGPGNSVRFQAKVLSMGGYIVPGSLLYLTWYRAGPDVLARLRGNSRWLLPVRLKRPRGSVNPNGFDYEGWLLRRGVYATGYLRPSDAQPEWLGQGWGLARVRDGLRNSLRGQPYVRPALIAALLLGDRSGLSEDERETLQRTGTAHLLAISGLHVGMVAGFLLLIGTGIARCIGMFTGTSPRALPVLLALLGVLAYTLLAGSPLSAQRAMVMTWVLLLALQWRRRIGAGFAFSLALALVLLIQPLAFYGVGFWLSFGAVAALLLGFGGRQVIVRERSRQFEEGEVQPANWWIGVPRAFVQLLRSQWLVALGLILPSVIFFSGYSSGGMVLNLLAIPWLALLILPALMVGALLMHTALGQLCLHFADWQLDLLLRLLDKAEGILPSWQALGLPQGWLMLTVTAGCLLLLLMPRGIPGRNLGWLFLLPLIQPVLSLPTPGREGFTFTALDVGQGLALALYSPQANIVFDAGPVSPSGWSAGNSIVAPFLDGRGLGALDALIVSHGDRDHAGGVEGLLQGRTLRSLYSPGLLGNRLAPSLGVPSTACIAGAKERFGDIHVRWLWPEQMAINGEENDHSCVALVEWRGVRLLLTGDISSAVERRLSLAFPQFKSVDVLVAPHHGSKTSSSKVLLHWAKPKRVIFSAGFRHHFGHPHADVVARYREAGVQIFNTAQSGAIEFHWNEGFHDPEIFHARSAPRFWYASHSDEEEGRGGLSRRE
ncbi:DNA internalization-related competence protein ComEC/Rec2 [Microbulbifer sp. GL-2]|uniref:DNA internalization-related competence protein ComEC/Rec2 n=1 Tax=Microbulbifer sp. GL-2 TaxID=2591606 RepID=UPI001162DEF5|nr:DNA internalization-related competence protein ComEC/Rec2 [Microbulbifer sp. GL-2]BBM03354.1 DNA internalization-related competence protein ComEC/Rec2 [Microbulbifer sp. GL-2]